MAELMADTNPDSTLLLIDSVMRMEAKLSDRERMEMALLQGDALYGGSLCPDDERSIPATVVPLPELDEAAAYYYPERNNSIGVVRTGIDHYKEAGFEIIDGILRYITK